MSDRQIHLNRAGQQFGPYPEAIAREMLTTGQLLATDLAWFEQVVDQLPTDSVKVAESGIHDAHDLDTVYGLGYNATLVGTSLMKSGNPGTALAELLKMVSA